MELSEWREELAGVIGRARDGSDHSPMCSDEEPCRYCTPIADALLASPAMARLLGEVRAEALREAAEELDALPSYRFEGGEDHYGEDRIHAYGRDDEAERIAGWLRDRATNAHPTDDHAGEAKYACPTCLLVPEEPDEPIQPGDYYTVDPTGTSRCPSCGLVPGRDSEGARRVAPARVIPPGSSERGDR